MKESLNIIGKFLSIVSMALICFGFSYAQDIELIQQKIKSIEALKDDPKSALIEFENSIKIAVSDTSKVQLANTAKILGANYYNIGNYRFAEPFLIKSAELYFELNDSTLYAWTLHTLALTQKYWGHYRDALQTIKTAENIFTKLNDNSGIAYSLMVEVYINEAWGRFDEIETICRESLARFRTLKATSGEAFCLLALGNLHLENNLPDSAWIYYSQAIDIFQKNKNAYGTALVKRDLGKYWEKKNVQQKALQNLSESLNLLESINNKRGISEVEMLLGNFYLGNNDFTKAVEHLEKGQALAIEIELVEDMVSNYMQLAKAYERIGNLKKSLANLNKFVVLKDSVFNAEKHLQLADMQTKYETEKKEQQIAIQSIKLEKNAAELSRKNIFIFSLTTGLLLLVILSILVYQLYRTKKHDNLLLAAQKMEIERKNQQITDSITYARRIQNAVLSSEEELQNLFPDSFILFKPKDIVSGDFFFFRKFDSKILITAVDCTGHGVPGAFMSMLGTTLLNEILGNGLPESASEVLEILREKAKDVLHQSSYKSESKDGMDMALCIWDESDKTIQFAGAGNPLYQIRKGDLTVVKGTRNPIGVHIKEFPFENHLIETLKGDCYYIFSDGYADQVGGAKGDKVKINEFKNLLVSNSHLTMAEQKKNLEEFITTWMQDYEQIDDILVMGFRV
ncbi:MAG TPA: tetratricopeptide repeat protein [Tenuifilaceae bacterium]|nr:tetratricopeptide repeat protein [Tenuifilaceae bacterium]HPE18882.1 tetratricopeptide repeat protein [Tenuifilaceae bacterium]HPJ46327.1 tetratricopeptide repeat protein [Tenuifilaceae bacterium]HPQ35742.1 tetratricopeptide repeat protein [Tenuifilaceae bacterium]HRX68353.1 tetratricopeptide repeat protein [Tenuifilaceae bacterium]